MNFSYTFTTNSDGICIITPSGRLNAVSVTDFKKAILDKISKEKISKIVIDMSRTDFIDSSGLSLLITILKQMREAHGFFRIAALTPDTVKIFKLTLLDRVFELYGTVDQAVKGATGA